MAGEVVGSTLSRHVNRGVITTAQGEREVLGRRARGLRGAAIEALLVRCAPQAPGLMEEERRPTLEM